MKIKAYPFGMPTWMVRFLSPALRPAHSRCALLWAALLLVASALPRVQALDCADPGEGLAGWWTGDDHAYNVVNQRRATLQGAVAFSPAVAERGFLFEGAGKLRVLESASLDVSRTNRWTITAWVRPAPTEVSTGVALLFSEGNRVAALGWDRASGRLVSIVNDASVFESATPSPAGVWTHVALVTDRGTRTFYINGVAAGSATGTPAMLADSTGAAIGAGITDDPLQAFVGELDELTVHRRALASAEIERIFAARGAGLCFGTGAPVFLLAPADQAAPLFAEAVFTGLAMSSPRPLYQWLRNGSPLDGETNTTLRVRAASTEAAGVYALKVSSGSLSATAEAKLTVRTCAERPAGLVAWWPGDGSGLEFSGQHPGALWQGVSFAEGLSGQAFQFDGANSYVAVPGSDALSPQARTNGEMTIEAWVNIAAWPQRDTATGQDRRQVLGKGDPGRWEYGLSVTTTGVPEFWLAAPDGADHAFLPAGQLLTNRWHHLAASFKSGEFLRVYQDGQLMGEVTNFIGSLAATAAPFYVGRRGDAQFFEGMVDEPAIYNRALTAAEIADLHALGAVGKCGAAEPGPEFVIQPVSKRGLLLNEVTLEALVLGTPRPSLQWIHNGTPLPGATNALLRFTNAEPANTGEYTLRATNLFGAVTSRPATLSLVGFEQTTESFELGWNGWSTDNYAIWQIGQPTSGPGSAFTGTNCAATVLAGNYPEGYESRLVSPVFEVPAAGQNPRLRFWHWWAFHCYDYGQVQIREPGAAWTALSDNYYWDGIGRWSRASFDLRAYAGKTIQVGFFFHSHAEYGCDSSWLPEVGPGWYLDDVTIETGNPPPMPASETFENGWGGWQVQFSGGAATEFGIWEIGSPTSGPSSAFTGTNCAATILSGNYPDGYEARLVSPILEVPAAASNPRLRFWHWWAFNCYDFGQVQIREPGGAWIALSDNYYWDGIGRWSRASLDLRAYAGKTVQLGFFFHSHADYGCDSSWLPEVGPGWYLDDITVETGALPPMPALETFENGWGGWQVQFSGGAATEFGIWEIGQPTSGPGSAFAGTNCAATILSGNYPDGYEARLVSPVFEVPTAGQNPRLRFWHWWAFHCYDYGQVQIREPGGAWTALSDNYYWDGIGRWSRASLDLRAYAGKTVQLGYFFHSHADYGCDSSWLPEAGPGWYLDDITVETGALPPMPALETFENGWGGWQVQFSGGAATEFGIWEIGSPTSGPSSAFTGTNCAATILSGNYPDGYEARLVSPILEVPAAASNPRLRFWHWWSFNCYDYGQVQIREPGGAWTTMGDQIAGASVGQWARASLALGAYAGKNIQIGFFFHSHADYGCDSSWLHEVEAGWYVDDLMIQVGSIGLVEPPPTTADERTEVTLRLAPVGANAQSSLSYSLPWAPKGAWIDPETGQLSWTPSERQGPAEIRLPVQVIDFGHGEANEVVAVKIRVNEVNERPWLLPAAFAVEPGQVLRFPLFAGDRDYPRNALEFAMVNAPDGMTLDANAGVLNWSVPMNAAGQFAIELSLSDHGSPEFSTNNIVLVTVSPDRSVRLTMRAAPGGSLEFTIHDSLPGFDYRLERAQDLDAETFWELATATEPPMVRVLPVDQLLEPLDWPEFARRRLAKVEWLPVERLAPTRLPWSFTRSQAELGGAAAQWFRVTRVAR